jgi:hypothetical protein
MMWRRRFRYSGAALQRLSSTPGVAQEATPDREDCQRSSTQDCWVERFKSQLLRRILLLLPLLGSRHSATAEDVLVAMMVWTLGGTQGLSKEAAAPTTVVKLPG